MPARKTTQTKKTTNHSIPVEPLWLDPPTPEIWRFDFGKFAFGLFLVIIGLLYLAKNSGWLPLDFDFNLWQLWPMLLIFFGLSFVSGRGWTGLLTGGVFTLTVLVIAGIFISNNIKLELEPELSQANTPGHLPSGSNLYNQTIAIDRLRTSDLANIQLQQNLGTLNLSANSNEQLVSGNFSSNSGKLLVNAQASASTQAINISSVNIKSRSDLDQQLNLQLAPNLPTNLAIDSGSSRLNLDLNELQVKNLQITSLGSDINLSANHANGNKQLHFSGPLASLNLNLSRTGNIKLSGPNITSLDLDDFKSINANTLSLISPQSSSSLDISFDTLPDKLIINWQ